MIENKNVDSYYQNIKELLIDNEVYKATKDYLKNKNDLNTYYEVGRELSEAGKSYGENIIKQFSEKLVSEVGKKYNERTLRRIRQFYNMFSDQKWSTLSTQLTWSHYVETLGLDSIEKTNYYIKIAAEQNLSVRQLREKIKLKEYERLDEKTKNKLITKEKEEIEDFIKNPIIIKIPIIPEKITEKFLKNLILDNMKSFLEELGPGFSYIGDEYKIMIGNVPNYIDLLLYNYIYNSFVVIELKVTELKKEHIGQIQVYMNYIDKNLKTTFQDKTIGIIICKKERGYVIEYSSDPRIYSTSYVLK